MLSHYELEIMELLWSEGRELTKTEIVDLSTNKSWKPNTIHYLLNRLMEKGIVKTVGNKRTGNVYGRTYTAAMSRDEYDAARLEQILPEVQLAGIFSALIDRREVDSKTLEELQTIIERKKKELEG